MFGKEKAMFGKRLTHGPFAETHRLKITGSSNMRKLTSPDLKKMLYCQASAMGFIGENTKRGWIRNLGKGVDNWNMRSANVNWRAYILATRRNNDAVNLAIQHKIDMLLFFGGIARVAEKC